MGAIKHNICIGCDHLDQTQNACSIIDEVNGQRAVGVGVISCDHFAALGIPDQTAKQDAGKLQITLVPTQIIRDIAEVRMYGNKKYGSADNWKKVEPVRYRDAMMMHLLAYIDDPEAVDAESGLPHLWHAACNMAFLCEMEVLNDEE